MSDDLIALGPGKVDLLESIDKAGSISEAARQGHISYRRAWDMVDAMNQCFKKPLVESVTGGKGGGGGSTYTIRKKSNRNLSRYGKKKPVSPHRKSGNPSKNT